MDELNPDITRQAMDTMEDFADADESLLAAMVELVCSGKVRRDGNGVYHYQGDN
jgi:hypothetical protein